jgi:hypothetical protein
MWGGEWGTIINQGFLAFYSSNSTNSINSMPQLTSLTQGMLKIMPPSGVKCGHKVVYSSST